MKSNSVISRSVISNSVIATLPRSLITVLLITGSLFTGSLITCRAQNLVTAVLTVTNAPVTSNILYVASSSDSSLRTFTNTTTASTIATNLVGVGPSATNIFNAFGNFGVLGVDILQTNTNVIVFEAVGLIVTNLGTWCTITLSTNGGTNNWAFYGPYDNLALSTRTNQASEMVYGLNTYPSNSLSGTSAVGTNFMPRKDGVQTNGYFAGPTLTNANIINGKIAGTTGWFGSLNLHDLNLSHPASTNHQVYGNLNIDTNSNIASPLSSASLIFNHQWELIDLPNGTLQYIDDDTSAILFSLNGTTGNLFTQPTEITNTLRVRYGTTSDTNTFTQTISSNNVWQGTNVLSGSLGLPPFDLTTLASGAVNIAVPFGTNVGIRVGSLSAATTIAGAIGAATSGGTKGQWVRLENRSGQNLTLSVSTADPVPANRFAGNDVIIIDQGWADLSYEATESRWRVVNLYPPIASATNATAWDTTATVAAPPAPSIGFYAQFTTNGATKWISPDSGWFLVVDEEFLGDPTITTSGLLGREAWTIATFGNAPASVANAFEAGLLGEVHYWSTNSQTAKEYYIGSSVGVGNIACTNLDLFCVCRFRVGLTNSGTDLSSLYFGLGNQQFGTNDNTDGIFFRTSTNVNNVAELITSQAGSRTVTTTTAGIIQNTWTNAALYLDSSGTNVVLYMGNYLTNLTAICTNTANIPNSVLVNPFISFRRISSSSGQANRTNWVDNYRLWARRH